MSKKSTHKLLLVVLLLVGLALSGCTGAGTGTPTGSFAELTIVVDGEGTVSPKEGPGKYGKGTLVSLTAEPAEGWEFAYWSGDVAQYDSPSTEVVVDDDKVITAVFYNESESIKVVIEDESGQPAPGVAVRFTDGSTLVANPDGVVIHNTKASDVVVAPQKLVQGEDPAGTFEPRGDIASKGDYLTFTMRPLEATGRSTLELTFNPVVFDDPNVLNPFASQRIREAIHYLVNRDYIADEYISGHATPCLTFISEDTFDYKFMADIIAELADKYAFNQALAEAIITEEMEALGAELVEGVWHYKGEPVTLKFIIREEDERKAIGEYIAGQLEAIGFTVQRLEKNGSEANPIWMIGDPHAGEWHLYTGGWTGSVGMAFSDTFLFQYFTTDGVSYSPLWQSYDPPEELASAAVQLWGENFRSAEERKEVFEQGLKSALEYAVRIGLVTKWLE